MLQLKDNEPFYTGQIINAEILLTCDEGILTDYIKGNSGTLYDDSTEKRDECAFCDYVPYFVMCVPDAPSTCDMQGFSFWMNQVLPSWNFNKDHYNKASADKLGPYNFTTYWLQDRDPNWFHRYGSCCGDLP